MVSPSFLRSTPLMVPRTEWACQPVRDIIWLMVAPGCARSRAIRCDCLLSLAGPAVAGLSTTVDGATRLLRLLVDGLRAIAGLVAARVLAVLVVVELLRTTRVVEGLVLRLMDLVFMCISG